MINVGSNIPQLILFSGFYTLFVAILEVDISSVVVKVAENDGITAFVNLSAGRLAHKRVDASAYNSASA